MSESDLKLQINSGASCRLDDVHEEKLKENLQCLCVPLADHKKHCEALLKTLKAKKGHLLGGRCPICVEMDLQLSEGRPKEFD